MPRAPSRPVARQGRAKATARTRRLAHLGMRRSAVVGTLLATILTIGLAGCGGTSSGSARLTVNGQAEVTAAHGGVPHAAHSGDIVHDGDTVHVTAGDARVRLVPSGVLRLRAGSQLVVAKTSHLISGAVLIQPAGQTLEVSAMDATLIVGSGAAQLAVGSATAGVTAKVYLATDRLDIAGNPPTYISAPRQVHLTPQTQLPAAVTPLEYLDSDTWDHLYLAEAELVSTQLAAAATGFDAQIPANQGTEASFYVQLLPSLGTQSDFAPAFTVVQHEHPPGAKPSTKPGDYLIASVIALRGTQGTFESRLSDELLFSAQGAPWGLVAYDQGVSDLNGVLNDVLAAIGRSTLTGASASQIAIGPPPTRTTPTTRPNRQTPSSPTTTTPANPRLPHPTTTNPPSSPPLLQLPVPVLPGALGSLLNPLLDPLIQALNNLLGGKH